MNRNGSIYLLLLAIGFFLGGAPAFAETQYSSRFRWGFEYKAFPVGGYDNLSTLSGDNSQGDMVGFRAAHFIEGSFIPLSVGFEAYVGEHGSHGFLAAITYSIAAHLFQAMACLQKT